MDSAKQVVNISVEEWNSKKARGLTAVVRNRPYLVMTHESTHEPVYQSVAIRKADKTRVEH